MLCCAGLAFGGTIDATSVGNADRFGDRQPVSERHRAACVGHAYGHGCSQSQCAARYSRADPPDDRHSRFAIRQRAAVGARGAPRFAFGLGDDWGDGRAGWLRRSRQHAGK